MDVAFACPCRPWDPGSLTSITPSAVMKEGDAAQGAAQLWVATSWLPPDLSSLLPPPSPHLMCNSSPDPQDALVCFNTGQDPLVLETVGEEKSTLGSTLQL